MVNDLLEIENRAGLGRVTCGWKKPALSLEVVRRYWRDVHSPGIARRPGVYEYRHLQFDPVRTDVFAPIAGVDYAAPANQQLMWLSDVRYLDQAGLDAFGASPPPEVKPHLLGDIDIIVDQSTTYLAVGNNANTYCDHTGDPAPQGPLSHPGYSLFFRQRSTEATFRAVLRELAGRWASVDGVRRLRLSLFEVPDMEAERKAGYPVKTHPQPLQYQAWMDLMVSDPAVPQRLVSTADASLLAAHVHTLHSYPTPVTYTSVYRGRPTLVGLRGYAAYDAIKALKAGNQQEMTLLRWMYGEVVQGGPFA
jgi:hypothetical protein